MYKVGQRTQASQRPNLIRYYMLEENGETQNLDKAKKEAEAQSNAEDSTSDAPVTQAEQVSETADASTAADTETNEPVATDFAQSNEAVEETVAEAVEDAGEDKDAGRLESLDPLVVALQVDEDDLNINNIYGIPTKVNVGDVLGILDGCEEVVEGYPESEIVGLGQVISIETDNTEEGSKSKFIKFMVLTPFKQLEDDTNRAKGAVASYEYVYFRHISQRSLEDIILPDEKLGIEVYNSSLPETDVVYKKGNNNELVLIMGGGNRKAGIGVINKHNGDYTLDIIILTEFEADDTAYGIWGPVDMINVAYDDIKLITPEDILGREFILEPERRE